MRVTAWLLLSATVVALVQRGGAGQVEPPPQSPDLDEQQTLLDESDRVGCSEATLKTAASEERLAKTTLQNAKGIGGSPPAGNGALVQASQEATARLQELQEDPQCSPFLSSVSPVAQVQEGIEKEVASKRSAKRKALAQFANAAEAGHKTKVAEEAAEKQAILDEKEQVFKSGGAEGVVKESKTKQQALDLEAEERVVDDMKESSAKTMPAMVDLVAAKKKELEQKFQMKLLRVRQDATSEGMRILIRSKEAGDKAFYTPAVRKETRGKQRIKWNKQDDKRRKLEKRRESQIMRLAAADAMYRKKLSDQAKAKAQEVAGKLQAASSNPNLLNEILAQNAVDDVAAAQENPQEPAVDPSGVTDSSLAAAITRYNNAVSGTLDGAALRAAELAADASPTTAPTQDATVPTLDA